MSRYELVIFDLDGTLVSSEALAASCWTSVMSSHLGIEMSDHDFIREFVGLSDTDAIAKVTTMYGQELPASCFSAVRDRYTEMVRQGLPASPGVEDAIKAILPIPMCVASNGGPTMVRDSIESAGLTAYFQGSMYSAAQVPAPKPAPDLFLFAAEMMGADPAKTVVIEDTTIGLAAAAEAGMTGIGYAGNALDGHDLEALALHVIDDFDDLPPLILQ